MSESYASAIIVAKNQRRSIYPWVWLFKADIDGTNGLHLAGSDVAITYGGVSYSAFPIGISGLDVDAESTLPTPTVVVSNVSREVAQKMEAGELMDRTCQLYLYSSEAALAIDKGAWRIVKVTASLDVATFSLAQYGLMDCQVPARRQERGRCDYVYGGTECRYQSSLSNLVAATYPEFAPTSCDLTLDGGNGCRAHGANEVAHGKPRLHPLRFGGLPGIPKGPARV